MFTPSNIKKLVNVSIINLKYQNIIYEIPIYPNTLQAYRKNLIPIENITHSDNIYKSVSKGLLQTKISIDKLPGITIREKIDFILRNGHEREENLTREINAEKKIRNVALFVMSKLKYKNRKISFDKAMEIVKCYSLNKEVKIMGNFIIKDIIQKDVNYETEKFLFKVDKKYYNELNLTNPNLDGFFELDGEELNKIKDICNQKDISYEIGQESDECEEILC